MTITLVRHLKVDFHWKLFYDARGFAQACAGYNEAPVVRPRRTLSTNYRIITSTLCRAIDTARLLLGREPDGVTELIAEVPMNPIIATSLFFPQVVWDAFARLHWLLNLKTQPETYADTAVRVKRFIDGLLAVGEDCVVVSHGWVLKVVIRRLHALGFSGPRPIYLKHGVPFVYER